MQIYDVHVISEGEQVAIISTSTGWHISYAIPDARYSVEEQDLPLSKRFSTYQEALDFWRKEYYGELAD